jgi:hypothetical protein
MSAVDLSPQIVMRGITDGTSDGYRHYRKQVTPGAPLVSDGLVLKWYDISFQDLPINQERQQAARRFLLTQTASLKDDVDQIGFTFLHDCRSVVFLFAGMWRRNNELWGRIYIQDEGETGFDPQVGIDAPHPIFCVWEMEVVWHETRSRTRYLLSERSTDDRLDWLKDTFTGLTPAT